MEIRLFDMKINFFDIGRKYWTIIAIISIVALGVYVRTYDYHYPYLRNIDSYAFTRQITDISEHGTLNTYDNLSLAPGGESRPISADLYVFIMAYAYNFVRFFFGGYTLFQFLIWAPALMTSLMAVPMYFIGRLLYDKRAGVLAAFFVVFDLSIMSRTLGGDPDNDASVLLFPLIAIALFLLAYKYTNQKGFDKKGVLHTIIAGIGMGAWGYVWSGFWFVIWLIAGFVTVKIILNIAKSRKLSSVKELKRPIILFVAVMLIFFVVTVPIFGTGIITSTVQGPFSFSDIKGEENRPFPNVYVSVAELQSGGTINDILQRTNIFLMAFMLASLVYLAVSTVIKKKDHIDTLILLAIWFIGPVIATTIGVRFSILFAAPVALGAGIMISKLFRIINGEGVTD